MSESPQLQSSEAVLVSLEETGMSPEAYKEYRQYHFAELQCKESEEQKKLEEELHRNRALALAKKELEEVRSIKEEIDGIEDLPDDEKIAEILRKYGVEREPCKWVVLDTDTQTKLDKVKKGAPASIATPDPVRLSTPEGIEQYEADRNCELKILEGYLPKGTELKTVIGKDAANFPVYITVGIRAETRNAIMKMHYIKTRCEEVENALKAQGVTGQTATDTQSRQAEENVPDNTAPDFAGRIKSRANTVEIAGKASSNLEKPGLIKKTEAQLQPLGRY
jgi:hypothetical protein